MLAEIASALTVGIDAHRVLTPGARGTAAATFQRSVYLQFSDGWVCVGAADIGHGPINVPCRGGPADWRRLGEGAADCTVAADCVIIAGHGKIVTSAPVWQPPAPPRWIPSAIARGLDELARLMPRERLAEGLACFAAQVPEPRNLAARAASDPVAALRAWLGHNIAGRPDDAVGALLGLGPGLTPSGDDLLAGCLVALRRSGRISTADALWRAVADCGPQATNPISYAHLASAAAGGLSEQLHRVLDAIMTADAPALEAALRDLPEGDHTSPWDGLAGIVLALERYRSCPQPS